MVGCEPCHQLEAASPHWDGVEEGLGHGAGSDWTEMVWHLMLTSRLNTQAFVLPHFCAGILEKTISREIEPAVGQPLPQWVLEAQLDAGCMVEPQPFSWGSYGNLWSLGIGSVAHIFVLPISKVYTEAIQFLTKDLAVSHTLSLASSVCMTESCSSLQEATTVKCMRFPLSSIHR